MLCLINFHCYRRELRKMVHLSMIANNVIGVLLRVGQNQIIIPSGLPLRVVAALRIRSHEMVPGHSVATSRVQACSHACMRACVLRVTQRSCRITCDI